MRLCAVAGACVALGACAGGSRAADERPARSTTAESPSADTSRPRSPWFPAVGPRERARLARAGLVRAAPPQLREACARVARQTEWLVVCPSLVPGGRLAVTRFGVSGTSKDFSQGYELSLDSGALRSAGAPDPGHWTIAVGTPAAMRSQITAGGRSHPISERRLRIGRIRVTRYREPAFGRFPGVYGGHVVYEWTKGRAVLQVSVHGTVHERVLRGLVQELSEAPDPSPRPPRRG